jgi:hypothetical protein
MIPIFKTPYFKIVIPLLIFFLPSRVVGQNEGHITTYPVADSSIYEESLAGVFFIPTEFYKGQKFFNNDWRLGTVILENGNEIFNKYLNYNIISSQLFWIRNFDYKQIILIKEKIKGFVISPGDSISKQEFIKMRFKPWYRIDTITDYLQVLCKGYINLYAFRRATVNKNSNEISPVTDYYVQVNKAPIKSLTKGRRALYSVAGENKDLMKKIVRGNHLKVRKEYYLIKAIKIFNQQFEKPKL